MSFSGQVEQLSNTERTTIRLPFDSTLRTEISNGIANEVTGARTTVSCLYWDSRTGQWSGEGIERLDYSVSAFDSQSWSWCSHRRSSEYCALASLLVGKRPDATSSDNVPKLM